MIIIPKNKRGEEYRVTLDDFKGQKLANIRVWFPADDGEMRPGRQGVAFRAELIEDFREALSKIGGGGNG